jgi:hypothetical protein
VVPVSSGEVSSQHGSAFLVVSFTGQGEAANSTVVAEEPAAKQSSLTDITLLESLYQKNSLPSGQADPQVLVTLIQRLAGDYQFADANTYLQKLMQLPDYEKLLDPKVIIYILMHDESISYENQQSINNLLPVIAQFRQEGLLTKDDEDFYD